jgi:hypothetical protein
MDETPQSFSQLQAVIQSSGRGPRTSEGTVKVIDPKTGETYEMSTSNARDKVRLDGWKMAYVEPPPAPVEESEDGKTPEVEAAPKRLDALEGLRKEYAQLAGKPADGRWGKKALVTKIQLLKES